MDKTTDLEKATIDNYNQMAESWAAEHSKFELLDKYKDKFKDLLPVGRVLEIGCGGGRDAKDLINSGYDYVGTDASAELIRVAKKNLPNADFRVLSVYDLNKMDEMFDGFWCVATLLHIPKTKIPAALSCIKYRLRPGAIGYISLKDGDTEEFEERISGGRKEARLFVYWNADDFSKVLNTAGFKIIEYVYEPVSSRTKWHNFFFIM